VRYLDQDTYAITNLTCCILTGTMLQALNNMKGVIYGAVIHTTIDIHYGSDSAGVVLSLVIE
jgi:hypothetical protein